MKYINTIAQVITALGCSIVLAFTVIMSIEFIKDEYTSITDIYTYTKVQNQFFNIKTQYYENKKTLYQKV